MRDVLHSSGRILGRLLSWALRLVFFGAVIFATIMLVAAFASRSGPPLEAWHTVELESEFRSGRPGMPADWSGYLELEEAVFAEMHGRLDGHEIDEAVDRWSRYLPESPSYPGSRGPNWNRSFTLAPAAPARGAAVLVHGLTDSPYSVRAIGEHLSQRGLHVVAPRMPGHGTHPGGLLDSRVEDWRAVVALAVEEGCRLAGDGPLYLGGYSTGAALVLDWAIRRIESQPSGTCFPRRMFMLSAAVAITEFASLAASHRFIAALPWFHQFNWAPILPEYDPWKYNSFAKVAGHEVWRLTRENAAGMDRLAGRGLLERLPPVTAFQSLVDNTVLTRGLVDGFFSRVSNPASELVIFDMNRYGAMETFLEAAYDDVIERVMLGPAPSFRAIVVSNLATDSRAVGLWHRAPGGEPDAEPDPLGVDWPRGVYSLSHVALPFPPDDPTYGQDSELAWFPGLASPRGEVGVLAVPLELFMRLRSNPFFDVVRERIDAGIETP